MKRALRFVVSFAALGALVSCSDTTDTTVSQLNLDRPTDISFACYGGLRITNGAAPTADQDVTVSAQPVSACDTRSGARDQTSDAAPLPVGQEKVDGGKPIPTVDFYAFMLQPVRGTVAIAHWDPKPSTAFVGGDVLVDDADLLTPGKNSISIGEDPVGLITDASGCKEVTANAGSCDLSLLDINSALDTNPTVTVDRLDVTDASGAKMRARPAAIAMEPGTSDVGFACGAGATGIAYIAYPSCHAVAAVDLSTGTVVSSITYDNAGVATVHTDGNLSCPDECGGTSSSGATTAGPRPMAMSLELDPRSARRALAIGKENDPAIDVIELDASWKPTTLTSYTLEAPTNAVPGSTLGVTALAITPQIGMGGAGGIINDDTGAGGQGQYIYAVATDHTVRVVDILHVNKECDTEIDPRVIRSLRDVGKLSCFPVDDPNKPRRRPGVWSPGIVIPNDGIPTSVAIARADPINGTAQVHPAPSTLIGYFAIITSTQGYTYYANVDDDDMADVVDPANPLLPLIPQAIAHQLRDGQPTRQSIATVALSADETAPICNTYGPDPDATAGNSGGARIVSAPAVGVPAGVLATQKFVNLPYIHQVECDGSDETIGVSELSYPAPVSTRDIAFPDFHALHYDETWSLTYEGSLSADNSETAVDGPPVREGVIGVDAFGMHLEDPTRPFCSAGVEPWDVVQLRGCDPLNGDSDCPANYTCYTHPDSQVTGIGSCMLTTEADRLADACKDYLISLRRYTVGKSQSGALELLARTHQLRTTPIDGCVDDAECKQLADYAATNVSAVEPNDDTTGPDTHAYTCRVDTLREPKTGYDGQPLRACIQTCQKSTDCDSGYACQSGTCMEGVEPPQACINAPERYELRSHDAFTVVGTKSGYVHPIIADANGNCVTDPDASPFDIGRIPLTAPACDPATDPRTGLKPDGTFDVNPCQYQVGEVELENQYVPGTCTPANPATKLVTRPTTGILFRNRGMSFTLVDPTYPGDANCFNDRGGALENVPLVFPGVQITFRQTAGFSPYYVSTITPSYPVKVVRGPTQSLWVIDEGDYLSTSLTLPSTRGKVWRFEAASPTTVNLLQ